MPTRERLGTDDRDGIEDRWKPSIQLDEEQAIVVGKPGPALHLTPQNDQLMVGVPGSLLQAGAST